MALYNVRKPTQTRVGPPHPLFPVSVYSIDITSFLTVQGQSYEFAQNHRVPPPPKKLNKYSSQFFLFLHLIFF